MTFTTACIIVLASRAHGEVRDDHQSSPRVVRGAVKVSSEGNLDFGNNKILVRGREQPTVRQVGSQGKETVRQEAGASTLAQADKNLSFAAAKTCGLSIQSMAVRMSSSVGLPKGNIEAQILNVPSFLRFSSESMKDCGWERYFWACLGACNETDHDEVLVLVNKNGPEYIQGTCAIAFATSNDQVEFREQINETIDVDKIAKKDNPSSFDPRNGHMLKTKQFADDSDKPGMSITAMRRYIDQTEDHHKDAKWADWLALVKSDTCKRVLLTGHSQGGSLAQIERVYSGKLASNTDGGQSKLDGTCYGKPCWTIAYGSPPSFVAPVPEIVDTDPKAQNWYVYVDHDPVPNGLPLPFGYDMDLYKAVYGADLAEENNHMVGLTRRSIYTGLKVTKTDEGTSASTGSPMKLTRYLAKQLARLGLGGWKALAVPNHLTAYYVYMVEAADSENWGFLFNPAAQFYVAYAHYGLYRGRTYFKNTEVDRVVEGALQLLDEAGRKAHLMVLSGKYNVTVVASKVMEAMKLLGHDSHERPKASNGYQPLLK